MALSTRDPQQTLSATRARQGRFGPQIVWVLVFGTLLAALALFAAWTWRSGDLASTEDSALSRAADSQSFSAPEPSTVIPSAEQSQAPPTTAVN